jgi:hypothetical protein
MGYVKKFPLAPLVKLRAHAVDGCRETLQERDLHLLRAKQAQVLAEQKERQYDGSRRAVEEQEQERLVAGELTARDLSQLSDYEVGARAESLRLRQHNQVQAQKLQRAEREHVEAEQALAEARASQRVIERQQERFLKSERELVEAQAEEEALDNWQVRKVQC